MTVRILSSLLVFLVAFVTVSPPVSAAIANTCSPAVESASGLEIVGEAYQLLSVLFVDRLEPDALLTPASQAVRAQLGDLEADPSLVAASVAPIDVGDWPVFADDYCTAWSEAGPDVSSDQLAYAAISAMTHAVDENHTRFLTPSMYEDHQKWSAGDMHYQGIGLRLRSDPLSVEFVFPGSPSEAAGLEVGDRILAIDGETAGDMTPSQAVLLLRGEADTTVSLTVQRPGIEDSWDVDIVRASIRVPVMEARMIGDIGYLRLDGFPTTDLPDDVAEQLQSFITNGAKGLVLDLRGNSGGRLDVGTAIASYFLPPFTPVYQQTTRRGQTTTTTSSNDRLWTRPVEVLVDGGTASMGEIMAASLQEEKVATVIGSTTAGSVAGSIVVPLSDGSAVQVTTLRIDSGRGAVLNKIGVQPDVDVPQDAATKNGQDGPLEIALARLRSASTGGPAPLATAQAQFN